MNSINNYREEYSQLLTEANKLIEATGGVLSSEQKIQNDKRYSKMDEIKSAIEEQYKAAQYAVENGLVENVEPRGKQEYNAMQGFYSPRNTTFTSRPLSKSESFAKAVNAPATSIGLGDFCRSMVLGARNDVERFALQSSTDSTNGYEVPLGTAAAVIDQTRKGSVFINAGAQVVPLNSYQNRIARAATNAAPAFRAESASIDASQSLEGVTFSLKTLAVIVKAPVELLEDSLNSNSAINDLFSVSFANALDKNLGWGTDLQGVANTTGIQSVSSFVNGDDIDDYTQIRDAVQKLQNYGHEASAAIMSPREMRQYNGLRDSTLQPLRRPDALQTLPFYASASAPINQTQGSSNDASTMLVGDFSKMVIGVRNSLRVEVLKEKYADTYEYGFRGILRVDAIVTNPKSFVKITGIVPQNAS